MQNVTKTNHKIAKIRLSNSDTPEIRLWKAVICQAIEDALITSSNKRKTCIKNRAKSWLTDINNEEIGFICELAGIKEKALKKYLEKIISFNSLLIILSYF